MGELVTFTTFVNENEKAMSIEKEKREKYSGR